ncbi:hypothetical protein EC968_005396 [Mortierella alpina]|nr:hypothetical protein EC968_005396 [Mortierella alpina]
MRRWKMFCDGHRTKYGGVDGQSLYLVDSEDKVISFFNEDVFERRTIKRYKFGADFRTPIELDDGERPPTQSNANIAQSMNRSVLYHTLAV